MLTLEDTYKYVLRELSFPLWHNEDSQVRHMHVKQCIYIQCKHIHNIDLSLFIDYIIFLGKIDFLDSIVIVLLLSHFFSLWEFITRSVIEKCDFERVRQLKLHWPQSMEKKIVSVYVKWKSYITGEKPSIAHCIDSQLEKEAQQHGTFWNLHLLFWGYV